MQHEHAALIKELADDTSLVKLVMLNEVWEISSFSSLPQKFYFEAQHRYRLVSQCHLEAALAFLNETATVQLKVSNSAKWKDMSPTLSNPRFSTQCEYRIKPSATYMDVSGCLLSILIQGMENGEEYFYRADCGHMQNIPSCAELAALYPHEEIYIEEE